MVAILADATRGNECGAPGCRTVEIDAAHGFMSRGSDRVGDDDVKVREAQELAMREFLAFLDEKCA